MSLISFIIKLIIVLLPFQLKRLILNYFFDFEIDRSAKMGVSWVYPKKLSMSSGAYIGHLNIIKNIELLEMGEGARVGHQNTVTCAEKGATRSFAEVERATVLSVGRGACITRKHYLDCTDRISIGNFVTVAGFNSQFLTHSIDVYGNKQSCESISIAEYSLLGTNSVVLPGSYLPSKVVVGASSLLNKKYSCESGVLLAGVPAKVVKRYHIDEVAYFHRIDGPVV